MSARTGKMQDVALPGFPAMGRGVEERIDRDRVPFCRFIEIRRTDLRGHGYNHVKARVKAGLRRVGRVAEGGGLLNRYRVKSSIGGSNPPLSATDLSRVIQ